MNVKDGLTPLLKAALFVCVLAVFYLVQLDLDLAGQFQLAGVLTLTVLGLMALPFSDRLEIRLVIFFAGAFLAFRYMYWRATSTLVITGMADFVPMMLLFIAELYSFLVFLCGLVINVVPLERPETAPLKDRPLPFVDILIPTYNEPVDLVKITATGCTLMDYPKDRFRVFILDDGATDARLNSPDPEVRRSAHERREKLQGFCKEVGIEYRSRPDNEGAKAGNINAALPACKGELLLILDCDHVPTRDFLRRTVGFFQRDELLFLVQTPHFMINANPVEKNLGLFADAPSESEMFYGVIQKGLDFWNSSFFCGSAALLRRKYLDRIGGISGVTVTEDAETSLELHSMGLRSAYFADPVTSGLSPETFRDFINQRTRWAQGMIQILLLKNPLFKYGLRLYQKVSYVNSCLYWFFGLARIVFIVAPLLYLFFGLHIYM
ncbi:MAG: glycosyltransferase, partial [Thermodesulfobacteria bacterium]|nr:glycosyltransferase [Thermodesulfobacteriota bacterium]